MKIVLKDLKSKEEVLDFLSGYLVEQINLARREMESKESFSLPAWTAYQAHQLGAIKAFKRLYNLTKGQND